MEVFSADGKSFLLAEQLGRGGEGTVYSVKGCSLAAKIYNKPPDDKKSEKLKAMAGIKCDRLLNISAWPLETLHSSTDGPVVGFLMQKITGFKEIHRLYSPKSRIVDFPKAGWDFLIHTGANLARAFSVIHGLGHEIGDINYNNITVSNKGMIMLIDCDSFQVNAGGHKYPCDVGVSIYQPPELQNIASFTQVIRTRDYDNFGLAVLIFQLLFMGRHPFAEKYEGADDMPLEKAISEKRFPYSRSSSLKRPPVTLSLYDIPESMAKLFEDTFLTGRRPGAEEWASELEGLLKQLRQCRANPSHKYYYKLNKCPWCSIEQAAGAVLFSPAAGFTGQSSIDIEEIWRMVEGIKEPVNHPMLPDWRSIDAKPSRQFQNYQNRKIIFRVLAISLFLCGFAGLLIPNMTVPGVCGLGTSVVMAAAALKPVSKDVLNKTKDRYNEIFERLNNSVKLWKSGVWCMQFKDRKRELKKLYESYKALESSRETKLKDIKANKKKYQLERFLSKHYLLDVNIKGMLPGYRSILQSYGIRTAADVGTAPLVIPGIKPEVLENLIKWRKYLEKKFIYDPGKSIDREMMERVDREFFYEKERIGSALLKGLDELKRLSEAALDMQKEIYMEIEKHSKELARAKQNLKAIGFKV